MDLITKGEKSIDGHASDPESVTQSERSRIQAVVDRAALFTIQRKQSGSDKEFRRILKGLRYSWKNERIFSVILQSLVGGAPINHVTIITVTQVVAPRRGNSVLRRLLRHEVGQVE